MASIILTGSAARRFWAVARSNSNCIEGDVVDVMRGCLADPELKAAGNAWKSGSDIWPVSVGSRIEAVLLVRSPEEADIAVRAARFHLSRTFPAIVSAEPFCSGRSFAF
ncbi:hypothetical protein WV31_10250 [Magnetospirillum sp. ME-1]|uniref:hypothetical protein n=1 Tax=Magnetospirillum sp. ME-1 TaxID=1639348 RepID=UPI000A17DB9B|nr:hypothetical protein [Magnetospirillum sp. ME-1]ARJ66007.1 hypothetical protein WV31_10250 [Magnetospirillum sp. ME-1]